MSPSIELLKNKFAAMLQAIAGQIDSKLDSGSAAVSANRLTNPFTLTIAGDADGSTSLDGSAAASINITLGNTGVAAGVYPKVTVDAKGRVTGGALLLAADIPALDAGKVTTGSFAVARIPDLDASKITSGTLAAARIPVLNQNTTGNAATATKLASPVNISMTGDGSWSISSDLGSNATGVFTLADSGAVAGVYPKVTINAKGLVTGGSALSASDIPSLDASKVASGVFAAARIPTLNQNTTGSSASVDGVATGGAFAAMYTRQGVAHASVTHSGSSYAPLGSIRYTGTSGVKGEYSFGHLSRAAADPGVFALHHITDGGVEKLWMFDGATGDFTSAGDIYNYSDKRLKEGFNVISNALDRIDYVTGYTFVRKDTGEIQAGFIADDWLAALPEVVDQTGEYLRLSYGNTNALTLNAVKELKAIVLKQAEEIEVLKNLVAQLIK